MASNFQNNLTGGAKNTPLYQPKIVRREESVRRPGKTVFQGGAPQFQPLPEKSGPMSAIDRMKQGLKRQ